MYKQRVGINAGVTSHYTLATRLGGLAPTLSLDFLSGSLDSRVTFTRGTTATFVGSNGLIQTAAINTPRFDYDPVTLNAKGLLIEEQRTNLLIYSIDMTTGWSSDGLATLVPNAAVSPDGTTNASQLQYVSNKYRYRNSTTTASTVYAYSLYAKLGTGGNSTISMNAAGVGATFNLSTVSTSAVTATSASIVSAGNGWYRCTIVFTSTGTTTTTDFVMNGTFTAGQGHYFYGAQLEAGAFATSYIPTVASQVTRSADVASMTGTNFSSWYNGTEGTFVSQFLPGQVVSAVASIVAASDGTATNEIYTYTATTSPSLRVASGGVQQVLMTWPSAVSVGVSAKFANAYKASDFATSFAGGTAVIQLSGTVPTVNRFTIGARGSGSSSICGHIQRIAYYPQRLPNTTLQRLTA